MASEDKSGRTPGIGQSPMLAEFVPDLKFERIPPRVVTFAKGLMIDWLGSVMAGKGSASLRRTTACRAFTVKRHPRHSGLAPAPL